jgi:hypothetical protein
MTETNGKPVSWWSKVPSFVGLAALLLSGVGGYYVLQYRMGIIEKDYVTREALETAVATALGNQKRQDQALLDLSDNVKELTQEIREMRGEWSNYSAHPKGHKQ